MANPNVCRMGVSTIIFCPLIPSVNHTKLLLKEGLEITIVQRMGIGYKRVTEAILTTGLVEKTRFTQ